MVEGDTVGWGGWSVGLTRINFPHYTAAVVAEATRHVTSQERQDIMAVVAGRVARVALAYPPTGTTLYTIKLVFMILHRQACPLHVFTRVRDTQLKAAPE